MFECPICSIEYNTKDGLIRHMETKRTRCNTLGRIQRYHAELKEQAKIDPHLYEKLWNDLTSHKPLICIPKSGNILIIDISRRRYFIHILGLTISSFSGIWFRRWGAAPVPNTSDISSVTVLSMDSAKLVTISE